MIINFIKYIINYIKGPFFFGPGLTKAFKDEDEGLTEPYVEKMAVDFVYNFSKRIDDDEKHKLFTEYKQM